MTAPNTIVNFAYGSNMLLRRVRERAPSATPLGVGRLRGHMLRWHKPGSKDGSGKCDALYTGRESDVVWGVLYALEESCKRALDEFEGLGRGYDEKEVEIATSTGPVRALIYYATVRDAGVLPFHWYKALVVAGARESGLPPDYVQQLEEIRSVADPDAARAARHEAIVVTRRHSP